jgi:hypothetical protein
MNSIIARLFVYINEVLSIFIIAVAFLGGLASMGALGFWGGLVVTSLSLIVLISIFGFAAMMIEMNKNLEAMNQNLKQLKNSYEKNNEQLAIKNAPDTRDQEIKDLDSMVSKIDSNKVDQFKNIIDSKNK